MPSRKYDVYKPAKPYFDLVRGALGDLVEGEHFSTSSPRTLFMRSSTTSPAGREWFTAAPN